MRCVVTATLLVTGLPFAALAQAPAILDPTQSQIGFTSTQMGVKVEGHFQRFDAKVVLDPRSPETGSVTVAIDTASATLGMPEPDAELRKPAWFDIAKFPQAVFQSTSIKSLGSGRLEVAGVLRIKGLQRECVIPVTLVSAGAHSVATGRFAIKRLDFKVGDGEWADTAMIGNDVQVVFKFVLGGL